MPEDGKFIVFPPEIYQLLLTDALLELFDVDAEVYKNGFIGYLAPDDDGGT